MQIVVADGLGGIFSALSFARLVNEINYNLDIYIHCICNQKVYDAIAYFVPFSIYTNTYVKHYNDNIKDLELAIKLKEKDPQTFILTPDYFGTHPDFSVEKTGITWREIQENQFLKNLFPKPNNKNVFLGLLTAQEGNSYPFSKKLISTLCEENENYNFYFSNIKKWSGKSIELDFDLEKLAEKHKNFIVYEPKSLVGDLIYIANTMNSFICLDNGIANFAYRLGRDRILLDSRYKNLAFSMRWRAGIYDCIPIDTPPMEVARLFKLISKNPELSNISKDIICRLPEQVLFDQIGYKTKLGFNK